MTNTLRYGGMLRCDQQTGLCYEDPNRDDPDECSTIGEKCNGGIVAGPSSIPKEYIMLVGAIVGLFVLSIVKGKKNGKR